MYIQIDNVGFHNKGAELMLYSIIDRISQEKDLEPKFVIGPANHFGETVRMAGLLQLAYYKRYGLRIDKLFPQSLKNLYGLVDKKRIGLVLDSGGFQFGDQWSKIYTKRNNWALKNYYSYYKKHGAKIIFLPQAYGPFTNVLARERIKMVHEYANMLYVRDSVSYNYLQELFGSSEKIKQAPDFTNLYKPKFDDDLRKIAEGSICIIPNSKMISQTSNSIADNYLNFLVQICSFFLEKNEKVILLNHEGHRDLELIKIINSSLQERCMVLTGFNAKIIKAIIGNSKLIITSRFHGLVSGLSQGIPTFCTGWSHKYICLLKDYDLSDNYLEVTNIHDAIIKVEKFADRQALEYITVNQQLINAIKKQEDLANGMWQVIFGIINT